MIPLNSNLSRLQRSAIRRFTNLARQTPDCILLTIGEPDLDTPQVIKDAAVAALADNQTHYAPNQGVPALRQAIAEHESRRGYVCSAEDILVTVGATEALYTALAGILNPGDEVVIPIPAYGLYESIVLSVGAVPVLLDTRKDDFQLTQSSLSQVITPRTKAIVLNSPNNPTGVVFTAESLAAVKAQVLDKPIYVICDNVYHAIVEGECPDLSLDPQLRQQVLLCQSFSKPYAMTGWRVGYLAAPPAVMERLLLLHAAAVSTVPTFLQIACVTALQVDTAPMAEIYRLRREYVCRRLDEMGLRYPTPRGAFYVLPDISRFGMDAETFCTRMIREGKLAAVPGSCFGAEGHIRISCCCSMEELETGMDRLERFIKTL